VFLLAGFALAGFALVKTAQQIMHIEQVSSLPSSHVTTHRMHCHPSFALLPFRALFVFELSFFIAVALLSSLCFALLPFRILSPLFC
jgi:hypothetical protein